MRSEDAINQKRLVPPLGVKIVSHGDHLDISSQLIRQRHRLHKHSKHSNQSMEEYSLCSICMYLNVEPALASAFLGISLGLTDRDSGRQQSGWLFRLIYRTVHRQIHYNEQSFGHYDIYTIPIEADSSFFWMQIPFLSRTRLGVATFPDNNREWSETSAAVDSVVDFAPTRFFWAACKASWANLSISVELMTLLSVDINWYILNIVIYFLLWYRVASHQSSLSVERAERGEEKYTRTHRFVLTATTEHSRGQLCWGAKMARQDWRKTS